MNDLIQRAKEQRHYTLMEMDHFLNEVRLIAGDGDLLALHKLMINKYGMPFLGTERVAYQSKSAAFKVPLSFRGFRYNLREHDLLHAAGGFQLAKTRMARPMGIPVLAMEIIHKAKHAEVQRRLGEIPLWAEAVEGFQVGFNRKGILKAYDYAELFLR